MLSPWGPLLVAQPPSLPEMHPGPLDTHTLTLTHTHSHSHTHTHSHTHRLPGVCAQVLACSGSQVRVVSQGQAFSSGSGRSTTLPGSHRVLLPGLLGVVEVLDR